MMNQNDKLERFSAQINRTAEKSVQKIQKQTEKISKTQLEAFRSEAQQALEERMTYAQGRLQREANGAVAKQAAARKRQAAQHREQIVDAVFDSVKDELHSFLQTQAYTALLKDCIAALLHTLSQEGAKIYVRAEDRETAVKFTLDIDPTAQVLVDDENRLGLAKAESKDGSVSLSDTFQSRLDHARAAFLSDCGLSVLPGEVDA